MSILAERSSAPEESGTELNVFFFFFNYFLTSPAGCSLSPQPVMISPVITTTVAGAALRCTL